MIANHLSGLTGSRSGVLSICYRVSGGSQAQIAGIDF